MKRKKLFGFSMVLAAFLMLGITFSGCSMGGDSTPAPQSVEYKSKVGEDLYILRITENTEDIVRAVYTPKAGDNGKLWIKEKGTGPEKLIFDGPIDEVLSTGGSSGSKILRLKDTKGTELDVTVLTMKALASSGGEEVDVPVMAVVKGKYVPPETNAAPITLPANVEVKPEAPSGVREMPSIPASSLPVATTSGGGGGGGDTTAPVLSDGTVTRTSDTAAMIGFTTNKAGTAYYLMVEVNAAAPANTVVRAGMSLGAVVSGANTGKALTLTAGAKDIYVVVQDAANNISAPLKITVAVYGSAFVAVTGITEVPTTGVAGTALTLSGTVAPENATNRTIVWTVKTAGTTGANISREILNTAAAGIVVVTATITNGTAASTNYTQDFAITISASGGGSFVAVTDITEVPTTGTAGTALTLSGMVAPENATNRTIVWTVKTAGTTGATISGDILNITATGTVVVAATIINGTTASTNYTQDFTITINASGGSGTPGLAYELINNGAAYNVGTGTVTSGAVVIPASYNGLPVTEIRNNAFVSKDIISVTIPASVVVIGESAFYSCTSLETVTFAVGSQLTSIGNSVFAGCTSLTSITIPVGVTTLGPVNADMRGGSVFSGCTSLKTITFAPGSQLTIIENGMFNNCTSLTGITIPAGVTEIGWGAFLNCTSLETVSFASGSRLKSIGDRAFNGCTNLTSINLPASVTDIGNGALSGTNLTSFNFPAGITSIIEYMFAQCTSLVSVTIPAGVTEIGEMAFYNCTSLETITFAPGSQLTSIGEQAFWLCTNLTSVTVPSSVMFIGRGAFINCTSLETVTFEPGSQLQSIGELAFAYCSQLTSINIPASVTSIDSAAFWLCTSLTSVTIPAGVTSISYAAFYECVNLTSVTFAPGSNLSTIGEGAFGSCTSLNSITIPTSVTEISKWAFDSCTSLDSITIPANVTYIGYVVFGGWTSSQTINIRGYSSQVAADAAWSEDWRDACDAVIKYWNGSEYQ
jgi:hypothetical protein